MRSLMCCVTLLQLTIVAADVSAQSRLPKCPGAYDPSTWTNCFGEATGPTAGIRFAAEFRNGLPNGKGTATYKNGDRYVGEMKDGAAHGVGTMTSKQGWKYVGDWQNGGMHGNGTWTSPGYKYVGEFRDNKLNGRGTDYHANGSVARTGIWENGEFARSR